MRWSCGARTVTPSFVRSVLTCTSVSEGVSEMAAVTLFMEDGVTPQKQTFEAVSKVEMFGDMAVIDGVQHTNVADLKVEL